MAFLSLQPCLPAELPGGDESIEDKRGGAGAASAPRAVGVVVVCELSAVAQELVVRALEPRAGAVAQLVAEIVAKSRGLEDVKELGHILADVRLEELGADAVVGVGELVVCELRQEVEATQSTT